MRLVGYAFAALFSGSVLAADPITIKIPCGSDPFPKCADLREALLEGSATPEKVIGLKAAVSDLLKDIYEGKIKVSSEAPGSAPACTTFNLAGKPPICPPLAIPEHGCRNEFTKNYLNETCAAISKVGPKGSGKYYYTLGKSSGGSLETANIAGGLVLAVSDRAAELAREVGANALVVPPASPCYTQAEALQNLIKEQTNVKLLELVKGCDLTNTETCSTKNYFEANLSTIKTAYIMLARCRLTDESTNRFRQFAANYPKKIEDTIVKDCLYNHGGDPAAMKACYRAKYETWVRARAAQSFPNVVAGCQGSSAPAGPAPGSPGSYPPPTGRKPAETQARVQR
jgi:hypothetical protein